jgi:phage baseplate assembly protein W
MPIQHKNLGVIYLDSEGVVHFGFESGIPSTVTGIDLLIQNIIIRLFTSRESNQYEPTLGGDLYEIIGQGYTPGTEDLLKNDFATAIAAVETQIKDEQSSQTDLPAYARLDKITLQSVEYNPQTYS